MKYNPPPAHPVHKETYRLETFSDAVFAIAITLLILDLVQILHPQNHEGLKSILLGHLNTFLSFGIGFLTILICWINHQLVFAHIRHTNCNLVWLNGFVLLVVSFTPFPTSILAEYFSTEPLLAIGIFHINYLMMSIAAYCITAYAYKKELVEESSRGLFRHLKFLYKISIVYTVVSFLICLLSVPVGILFYSFLFVVFAFPEHCLKKLAYRKQKRKRIISAQIEI